MKKQYKYFVSFWIETTKGTGNAQITLDKPITSVDQITDIQNALRERPEMFHKEVIINNFILLV